MTKNPIAYSFLFDEDDWVTYCLACGEEAINKFGREADAELLSLNGDVMECESCGVDIRD